MVSPALINYRFSCQSTITLKKKWMMTLWLIPWHQSVYEVVLLFCQLPFTSQKHLCLSLLLSNKKGNLKLVVSFLVCAV